MGDGNITIAHFDWTCTYVELTNDDSDDGALEHELMSVKHIAKDPSEKQRIEDAGGAVFSGRVFGTLAVSRSLGDRDYKIPTSENNFVSSEPYFTAEPLGPQEKFLLLACDGVWDQVRGELFLSC